MSVLNFTMGVWTHLVNISSTPCQQAVTHLQIHHMLCPHTEKLVVLLCLLHWDPTQCPLNCLCETLTRQDDLLPLHIITPHHLSVTIWIFYIMMLGQVTAKNMEYKVIDDNGDCIPTSNSSRKLLLVNCS